MAVGSLLGALLGGLQVLVLHRWSRQLAGRWLPDNYHGSSTQTALLR